MQCIGITNECYDGSHVIFMDYDTYLLRKIEAEIKRLQEKYKLSDFVILQTSKDERIVVENGVRVKKANFNYFAFCIKKLPYKIVIEVLNESHCDRKFIRKHGHNGFPYKCDVMRITKKGNKPKPFFVEVVKSKYKTGVHSYAHALIVKKFFGIEINPDYKYDSSTKVLYHIYESEAKPDGN